MHEKHAMYGCLTQAELGHRPAESAFGHVILSYRIYRKNMNNTGWVCFIAIDSNRHLSCLLQKMLGDYFRNGKLYSACSYVCNTFVITCW